MIKMVNKLSGEINPGKINNNHTEGKKRDEIAGTLTRQKEIEQKFKDKQIPYSTYVYLMDKIGPVGGL